MVNMSDYATEVNFRALADNYCRGLEALEEMGYKVSRIGEYEFKGSEVWI